MHVDADAAGLADTKGPLHKHWVCVRQRGGLQVRRRERTTCAVLGSISGDVPRVEFCEPVQPWVVSEAQGSPRADN